MNNKTKYGFVALILAIALFFIGGLDAIHMLSEPIHINYNNAADLESGDHVILDITMTVGAFITEGSKSKSTGKITENYRTYLIPIFNESYTDLYGVNVKIAAKDFNTIQKAEDVFRYSESIPKDIIMTVEGVIKEMDSDEKSYLKSRLNTLSEELPGWFGYDNVFEIYIKDTNKTIAFVFAGLSILLLIAGILLLVFGLKQGAVQKANRQALVNANYYTAPQNVTFNNDPNSAQHPQDAKSGFNPYGIQNDPRFNRTANNAQNVAEPSAQNSSNVADQIETSFNEVKVNFQEASTPSFNELPVAPIADLTPINIDDNK